MATLNSLHRKQVSIRGVAPLEQVVLKGSRGGGGMRGDAQLTIERGGMAVDGAQADHQVLGNLGIGEALGKPVLATCGIRRPELACENTSCCLLLLADSPEEEYNLKHASAHLYK